MSALYEIRTDIRSNELVRARVIRIDTETGDEETVGSHVSLHSYLAIAVAVAQARYALQLARIRKSLPNESRREAVQAIRRMMGKL